MRCPPITYRSVHQANTSVIVFSGPQKFGQSRSITLSVSRKNVKLLIHFKIVFVATGLLKIPQITGNFFYHNALSTKNFLLLLLCLHFPECYQ
uniref:Uncharacterized protein n=1 Tax=Pyxicephalus adspersus TaxID=30357 RepID=A0AAV3AH86_PYXAD|nr:TPA: hypothetical protein GDO54_011291 [Pyxicephalus adspersus]